MARSDEELEDTDLRLVVVFFSFCFLLSFFKLFCSVAMDTHISLCSPG